MENVVKADLQNMDTSLRELARSPGLEVFPTTPAMLARSTELCFELPELKSWDQAVLAAVLIRADELHQAGKRELAFANSTRIFSLGTRMVMPSRS
jgi:O-antigen ligase